MINKVSLNNNYNPNFGHEKRTNMTPKQKAVVLMSSAAGMTPVLAVLAKRKGFSLNPRNIINTPIKDWAIFKYAPKGKAIKYDAIPIVAVATGSVLGGYAGGVLVDDKSQRRAKKREILNQILGNVIVPVSCVWTGSELYGKFENRLKAAMPQFKKSGKYTRIANKCLRNLPQAVATIASLCVGIFCGNKVSNYINEQVYKRKVDRNIRATDFAPHVDDLCMATSMMNKGSNFGDKIGRVIPLALIVPGYQTGIAQESRTELL
jgi:hypothetical protein